jgi:predicted nucleic acid-binding protein
MVYPFSESALRISRNYSMNKIIISDTSCLIALSNIGLLNLLEEIYEEVIITAEVSSEFGNRLPEWIIVTQVKDKQRQSDIENHLDKGEASSIALALEIPNSMLIIDEVKGRNYAKVLNIEIIGTIGVLILAGNKGLIKDVISIILKLVNQGFRLSNDLIAMLIEKYGKK